MRVEETRTPLFLTCCNQTSALTMVLLYARPHLFFNRITRVRRRTLLTMLLVGAAGLALLQVYSGMTWSLTTERDVIDDHETHLLRPGPPHLPPHLPAGSDTNIQDGGCEMCDETFVLNAESFFQGPVVRDLGQEKMPLFRHYTGHQPWPRLQLDLSTPGKVPATVHYLWCKQQDTYFGFHHYLGVLSALRLLQPSKVVFHCHDPPPVDVSMYYTWFLELKQSLPSLELRRLPAEGVPCGSPDLLYYGLSFLQRDGGVLLGANVIISRLPRDLPKRPFWFAAPSYAASRDYASAVVVANRGFDEETRVRYVNEIMTSKRNQCVTPEVFDVRGDADSARNAPCVFTEDESDVYPVGIMYANSSFGQLSRWLYYGTRSPMYPKASPDNAIPRISHLVWFSPDDASPYVMEFYQYLTVLSALYVGGFHHVYIHGNAGFTGQWWLRLRKQNVTFVHMDKPETVFQQRVGNPSHQSDIARYEILNNYGGAYHDFEAMWTSRVPDWLLEYPCVATSDWVAYGDFPDGVNPGVLLAKKNSPWIRHNLAAHRFYVDKDFVWNAVLGSYRTYERHPDQLLYYRHLQVMCHLGICHPSWVPGWRRDVNDRRPTEPFDWRTETLVVHVTMPDPEVSFRSPAHLRGGEDMFAEIGRNILMKSDMMHLLDTDDDITMKTFPRKRRNRKTSKRVSLT